jgi:hypothetical protein
MEKKTNKQKNKKKKDHSEQTVIAVIAMVWIFF